MKIAIDGPAGSGKGTICSKVADYFGFFNFSSGEVYRLATLLLDSDNVTGIQIKNPTEMIALVSSGRVRYSWNKSSQSSEVYIDNVNIKPELHRNDISIRGAIISHKFTKEITDVAQYIVSSIKEDLICEGRNVATHIIPNADIKIYLDASPEVRASRRLSDVVNQGEKSDLETILAQIKERDRIDSTREYAPLVRLPDAIYLDTSLQTPEESIQNIITIIKTHSPK
jgi:CMP/dCMP kinase